MHELLGMVFCSLSSDLLERPLHDREAVGRGLSLHCLSRLSFQSFVGGTMLVWGQKRKLLPYKFSSFLILRVPCVFFLQMHICLILQQIYFHWLSPALCYYFCVLKCSFQPASIEVEEKWDTVNTLKVKGAYSRSKMTLFSILKWYASWSYIRNPIT